MILITIIQWQIEKLNFEYGRWVQIYAGTQDFISGVINIIFEADEGRDSSVLSALAALPVIDDEFNEATEVFAVQLVLIDGVDPDMITLVYPAASLCTIVDDDRKYSLIFPNALC